MKVVWLCHFSNIEVQKLLSPYRLVDEMAPWIASLANLFEDSETIELHIISPHEYIGTYNILRIRGIHYYFFNAHIPFWGRHWPGFLQLDYWTNFFFNKLFVRKVINRIKPDIIHLHGAENAYYSSTILQFINKYPILVTIQGFISKTGLKQTYQIKRKIFYESQILKSLLHFGYRTKTMASDIKRFNPDAVLHWHHYPIPSIKPINSEKKFDIVFFAQVSKDKGIEDLLKALSIIKDILPNITVCIIGFASVTYFNFLKNLAIELSIAGNIFWAGFLQSQADVHKLASTAKICVLPTKHDIISGTIIESMFLKLPVVAYSVGSIPEINEKDEFVSLVKKGDIRGMADEIIMLLTNDKILKDQGERAYLRAVEMFDNSKIHEDLLNAYKEVIRDFKLVNRPAPAS